MNHSVAVRLLSIQTDGSYSSSKNLTNYDNYMQGYSLSIIITICNIDRKTHYKAGKWIKQPFIVF